jgi:mannose-1-phosphate guanylyltransferase/mannose-6-phosphate isomerase
MKIIPVILCGGIGSRLWPVSRENNPKQFLKIDGDLSLFQKTVMRASEKEYFSAPLIICSELHKFKISAQLKDIEIKPECIITEPEQKNTASAIALASHYASNNLEANKPLLIMPADHAIKEVKTFVDTVKKASLTIGKNLMTFGIEPTSPSSEYGYIKKGESNSSSSFTVENFTEKPKKTIAQEYINSGQYFWNSGIFLFTSQAYLNELEKFLPETFFATKLSLEKPLSSFNYMSPNPEIFSKCENISIDYAVMEKTKYACVTPLKITWHDLGAWNSIYDYFDKDQDNNALIGGNVTAFNAKNCLVYCKSDKHIVLNDVENLSIIDTEDALLVMQKDSSSQVKTIYNHFKNKNSEIIKKSNTTYRPWGYFTDLLITETHRVKIIHLYPKSKISLQYHNKRAEHWVITKGIGSVTKGKKEFELNQDESVYIPHNEVHMIENKSDNPLEFIEVQIGSYVGEDDIVRLQDQYGRK